MKKLLLLAISLLSITAVAAGQMGDGGGTSLQADQYDFGMQMDGNATKQKATLEQYPQQGDHLARESENTQTYNVVMDIKTATFLLLNLRRAEPNCEFALNAVAGNKYEIVKFCK